MNKYLIIRFSSFGDIAQALPAVAAIREYDPTAEIHFLTRSDFANFAQRLNQIDKVIGFEKHLGLIGLIHLARSLKSEKYTHIYDAHSNLRSLIVSLMLILNNFSISYLRRPKDRLKRLLLFWFRVNQFPQPFKGIESYLEPLKKWFKIISFVKPLHLNTQDIQIEGISSDDLKDRIAIAPSATWDLKRWPIEHWIKLIELCPNKKFTLLAGKDDYFCDEILRNIQDPAQVLNLRGKLSWSESIYVLQNSKSLISGDTGLLHIADVLSVKSIALIGPSAFGYPSRPSSYVLEADLSCRPCSKDGSGLCTNEVLKKCMKDIEPTTVAQLLRSIDK